ncbi:MAG: polysaccharide deacetylase [Solirubrobacterales bacterium]|nr:polysaccharide deacetylase [Solirubrobacterales bacterium]
MSDRALVSVVMCFLDAEHFIEEAIESVFAQTHGRWELVLVDDGSRDRSTEIARRYARNRPDLVRYVEHPGHRNRGKSASRNAGIAAGAGTYVGFLDSDDVLLPHALATLVAAMEEAPGAAVAYGRTEMWFSWPGNPDGRTPAWDFESELPARGGTVVAAGRLLPVLVREDDVLPSVCSALVRRAALETTGGWEPSFVDVYDDFVLWTKLFAEHDVLIVDEKLSRYRKHEASSCEQATRNGEWSPVDLNVARYRYLAWMEHWLTRRRLGDAETWRALDASLQPYRHPTAPVEVEEVEPLVAPGVHAHLDHPRPGFRTRSHRIPIGGWLAGEEYPLAVEFVADGRRVSHVALDARRPDVAAMLGLGRGGDRHGFLGEIALAGAEAQEIEVSAVLRDQRRVPLARVRARRVLRPEDRRLGAPTVSVVIVCSTEARELDVAIERALAQDHRPLEVVAVDDGSSSALEQIALAYPGVRYVRRHGEGLVAARRAGLERSQGELVLFLSPHDRLLPTAISAALARLAQRPECGWVVGSGGDRPLDHATLLHDGPASGPTLYRRVAIVASGGIPDAPPGLEDGALQVAVARELPGIAIADPMLAAPSPPRPAAPGAERTLLRAQRKHAKGERERQALIAAAARLAHADADRTRRPLRRRRRAYARGRALILLYHRVAELPADPWALGVGRARFAEQLAVLRSEATVLSLQEIVERVGSGGLPERAVAVTFDDGYRDNLLDALPELEAARVPATFFLTAGPETRTRELWWDEIERVLLSPGSLPPKLRLLVGGRRFAWDLADSATLDEAAAKRTAAWRIGQAPPTPRHAAYEALWEALFPLAESARVPVLDELLAWAGDPGTMRETHRLLDAEEVATLARSHAAEVGGHSITHPRLSSQRPMLQEVEIAHGKAILEEVTGRPLRHFAYPFGGLRDYTGATARMVADAGYASASATWEGLAHAASDPFQLPRVQVGDVAGETFAAHLARWFER